MNYYFYKLYYFLLFPHEGIVFIIYLFILLTVMNDEYIQQEKKCAFCISESDKCIIYV